MTTRNQLLKNIFYGNEIANIEPSLRRMKSIFCKFEPLIADAEEINWKIIERSVINYFSRSHKGAFGGNITAGDALFLAAFMEKIRPNKMIEIGVASGYSSAFILNFARDLNLLSNETFLYSFDLLKKTAKGQEVGSLLRRDYPNLEIYWSLSTNTTSIDLLNSPNEFISIQLNEKIIAFVDGGHKHPWPIMDIIALRSILPNGSWIIMQDFQMIERWLADCVEYGATCPVPVRGVNLAVTLWPGTKLMGFDICYNSAAIKLDVGDKDFSLFVANALNYCFETKFDRADILESQLL